MENCARIYKLVFSQESKRNKERRGGVGHRSSSSTLEAVRNSLSEKGGRGRLVGRTSGTFDICTPSLLPPRIRDTVHGKTEFSAEH